MGTDSNYTPINDILGAMRFAAYHHRNQKRKGRAGIPYINHPIEVSHMLSSNIKDCDKTILLAAILHDTIEDTKVTKKDLSDNFGKEVANIVEEVTDNMNLPYNERKACQIKEAPYLSYEACCIKIADKTCNISDMVSKPMGWSKRRKIKYINWAINVVGHLQHKPICLIKKFDQAIELSHEKLNHNFIKT